jgi:hypothetical protein
MHQVVKWIREKDNYDRLVKMGLAKSESEWCKEILELYFEDEICLSVLIDIPPHILDRLAYECSDFVRMIVARHLATRQHTLKKLAKDHSVIIRLAVAHNPNTESATLVELSTDEDVKVREAVLINANTPVEVRNELRSMLVYNSNK